MAKLIQQGNVLTVAREGESGQHYGGKRGTVKEISRPSRNRLMRFIGALERFEYLITLTYPDTFSVNPADWKRDLKTFSGRVSRLDPAAAFVWRLGLRRRKSGKRHGEIAPHFQLLFYGNPDLLDQHRANWADIAGMERWYCEKVQGDHLTGFMAKWSSLAGEVDNLGRWWGAYFRPNLPIAEAVEIEIDEKEAAAVLDRMKEVSGVTRKLKGNRYTIIGTVDDL